MPLLQTTLERAKEDTHPLSISQLGMQPDFPIRRERGTQLLLYLRFVSHALCIVHSTCARDEGFISECRVNTHTCVVWGGIKRLRMHVAAKR